jgi:hypothetical protein
LEVFLVEVTKDIEPERSSARYMEIPVRVALPSVPVVATALMAMFIDLPATTPVIGLRFMA